MVSLDMALEEESMLLDMLLLLLLSLLLPMLPLLLPLMLLLPLLLPPLLMLLPLLPLMLLLPQLLLPTLLQLLLLLPLLSNMLATMSTIRSTMFPKCLSRDTHPPTPPTMSSTTPQLSVLLSPTTLLPLQLLPELLLFKQHRLY